MTLTHVVQCQRLASYARDQHGDEGCQDGAGKDTSTWVHVCKSTATRAHWAEDGYLHDRYQADTRRAEQQDGVQRPKLAVRPVVCSWCS